MTPLTSSTTVSQQALAHEQGRKNETIVLRTFSLTASEILCDPPTTHLSDRSTASSAANNTPVSDTCNLYATRQSFDAESVVYAANISIQIEEKQSLFHLMTRLSEELKEQHQWVIKFRVYDSSQAFDNYSGYVIDNYGFPRIEFVGRNACYDAHCSASILSFEDSLCLRNENKLQHLGNQPRNIVPNVCSDRLLSFLYTVEDHQAKSSEIVS